MFRVSWLTGVVLLFASAAPTPGEAESPDSSPILRALGVKLKVTERPAWPEPPRRLDVTLAPQADGLGSVVVSFGLPFGPGWLTDDGNLRVIGPGGAEISSYTRPLAWWWMA